MSTPFVRALKITLAVRPHVGPNVRSIPSVSLTKRVLITSVSIHVHHQFAAIMLAAKPSITILFVVVHWVILVILSFVALRELKRVSFSHGVTHLHLVWRRRLNRFHFHNSIFLLKFSSMNDTKLKDKRIRPNALQTQCKRVNVAFHL